MRDPKKHLYLFLFLILVGSSVPGGSVPEITTLTWDKLLHVIEYTIMGFLGIRAFNHGINSSKILLATSGMIFACIDEAWQTMIPGRFSSQYDIIADVIGVILGVILGSMIYKNQHDKEIIY